MEPNPIFPVREHITGADRREAAELLAFAVLHLGVKLKVERRYGHGRFAELVYGNTSVSVHLGDGWLPEYDRTWVDCLREWREENIVAVMRECCRPHDAPAAAEKEEGGS